MRRLLLTGLSLALWTAAFAAVKPVIWRPVQNAFLRVNDQPVKDWDAFEIEKKTDGYLLALEGKFLLVNTQSKEVFEIPQNTLQRQGAVYSWDPATLPQKPIAT